MFVCLSFLFYIFLCTACLRNCLHELRKWSASMDIHIRMHAHLDYILMMSPSTVHSKMKHAADRWRQVSINSLHFKYWCSQIRLILWVHFATGVVTPLTCFRPNESNLNFLHFISLCKPAQFHNSHSITSKIVSRWHFNVVLHLYNSNALTFQTVKSNEFL